jgi:hypothetical protein
MRRHEVNEKRWSWLKVPIALLENPTYGRLADRLYRRAMELRLLAGRQNEGGLLPNVEDIAWSLHVPDAEDLETDLVVLEEVGILERKNGRWIFAAFEHDQAPGESTERVRRFRERRNAAQAEAVTVTRYRNARETAEVESERESESEQEKNKNKPSGIAVAIPPRALFHERTKDGHYRLFDENGICQDYTTKAGAMKYPEWRG